MLPPCSWGGMARTLKDANLDKPEARSRLAARGKPHYRLIEPGLHPRLPEGARTQGQARCGRKMGGASLRRRSDLCGRDYCDG